MANLDHLAILTERACRRSGVWSCSRRVSTLRAATVGPRNYWRGAGGRARRGRGGFSAVLLDDVMTGAAILALGRDPEPRLIFQSLDYFTGAGPGDFTAEGWVVSVGPHHCLTRAELRAPSALWVGLRRAGTPLGCWPKPSAWSRWRGPSRRGRCARSSWRKRARTPRRPTVG